MNLEKKIKAWRRGLHRHAHLEQGFIEELEVHLRDAIEASMHNGMNEADAFEEATRNLGDITSIGKDEKQAMKSTRSKTWLPGLIRNFLKVNTRQFKKNGALNTMNIVGLTGAFTAILFIVLYIHDELTFERHHPDAEKIYRLAYQQMDENGKVEKRAFSSGMWVDVLKDRVPMVEETCRIKRISYGYVENLTTHELFYEEGIYWSDPDIFDFFHFPLKYGRKEDQLTDLSSVVITEATALQVFGEANPIGKTMKYVRNGQTVGLQVTGVMYDPPSNSQFQPKYIAHLQALQGIYGERDRGWIDMNPNPGYVMSFVKLDDPESVATVEQALTDFWSTAIPERAKTISPLHQRLLDIHFEPAIKWEMDSPVSMTYIYGLVVIATFILVIAMTNFINLITVQGGKRQKEIGLRKTLGSTKYQLRLQFFMESAGLIILSVAMAVGLVTLLLPSFNDLTEKRIDLLNVFSNGIVLAGFLLSVLLISAIAGVFPAFYFTRKLTGNFNLNEFFKSERASSKGRNALVALQFTVAISLTISTITVYNQLKLINSGKLGNNREAVLGIRTSRMGTALQAQRFRDEIEAFSQVSSSTLGMHLPRQSDFGRINTKYLATDLTEEAFFWNKFDADGDFVKTFDLELIAGHDFKQDYELNSLIINESAARELGLNPNEAIGLRLREDSISYVYGASHGVVIGVVKDFAYKSVKEKVEPLVICANTQVDGALSVKLSQGDKQEAIQQLGNLWAEIYPGRPFEYWFLDQEFDRLYNQERRLGKLIPLFSGLAVVIALLGLFALTAYIAELRKKEIGIRKVLGCSSSGILKLLSWQYLKTILISILIGLPLAWYGMNLWLDNFTYRVEVNAVVMGGAVLFIVLISFLTILIKSLKAAHANPVESLKCE